MNHRPKGLRVCSSDIIHELFWSINFLHDRYVASNRIETGASIPANNHLRSL